jgi:hypothetical protein
VEFAAMNLCELRSVLAVGARVAHETEPVVVTARHVIDATNRTGRQSLWWAARMMTSTGGRLYLEFLAGRGSGDEPDRRLHPVRPALVQRELEERGATVLSKKVRTDAPNGRRICRMVVAWQR